MVWISPAANDDTICKGPERQSGWSSPEQNKVVVTDGLTHQGLHFSGLRFTMLIESSFNLIVTATRRLDERSAQCGSG